MIELTLPTRPRRAQLRAFAIALAILAGLVAGGVAGLLDVPVAWLFAAVVGGAVALLGLAAPAVVASAYRLWNRLAVGFARRGQRYVLWICYYAILVPVAAMGSRMRMKPSRPGVSAWEARRSLPADAYWSQHSASDRAENGWRSEVMSWSGRRSDLWVWALIPFLAFLRSLSSSRTEHTPENIYTLY